MASTRNKNTQGNYELEQLDMYKMRKYEVYQGKLMNDLTCFAGDGLLPGRYPMQLYKDTCDIETELFGIGSTNLVNPRTQSMLPPENRPMKTLNIIQKADVILPTPLVIQRDQRYTS
jgi:hypothetical protein